MHDFESFLTDGARGEISAERLKSYGQRAAAEFVNDKVPLNTTIAGFAKEAGLNPEQTKRVVEEANNATFRSMFKVGFSQNIEFPVADFDAIVGGCGGVEKTAAVLVTNKRGRQYIPGAEGARDCDIFGVEARPLGLTKEAAAEVPTPRLENLVHELSGHKADVQENLLSFSGCMNAVVHMSKVAASEGHSADMIGAAIEAAGPGAGLLSVLKSELEEVANFGQLEKIAQMGMEVSPQSPFTGLVQDLEAVSQKLVMSQQMVNQTQMTMDSLLQVLRGPAMGMGQQPPFQQPGPAEQMPAPPPEAAPPGAGAPAPAPAAPMVGPNG